MVDVERGGRMAGRFRQVAASWPRQRTAGRTCVVGLGRETRDGGEGGGSAAPAGSALPGTHGAVQYLNLYRHTICPRSSRVRGDSTTETLRDKLTRTQTPSPLPIAIHPIHISHTPVCPRHKRSISDVAKQHSYIFGTARRNEYVLRMGTAEPGRFTCPCPWCEGTPGRGPSSQSGGRGATRDPGRPQGAGSGSRRRATRPSLRRGSPAHPCETTPL